MDSFTPFLTVAVFLILYFLPSINAKSRHHNNTAAIVMLNVLLGWTVAGWIVAMIWSMTDNRKAATPTSADRAVVREAPAKAWGQI